MTNVLTEFFASIWQVICSAFTFAHIFRYKSKTKIRKSFARLLFKASSFEEWEAIATQCDVALGKDKWRDDAVSRKYDYNLIRERLESLEAAREQDDVTVLVNLLRSGMLRNLGHMCHRDLYNQSYVGTKLLIESYIRTLTASFRYIAAHPPSPYLPPQTKLDILHDTRQSFGRTSLILQGGAIFGLYHIGVVKALHLRNLLPRIITGTGVGALIAALVCIHTDGELPIFLSGDSIDLSAFSGKEKGGVKRKFRRVVNTGYLLDIGVIEQCVRANVGDLTFEEAYLRTKRVLNVILAPSKSHPELPLLLNHITAPNVLIYTAACASNATGGLYQAVELLCKDHTGRVVPYTSTLPQKTLQKSDADPTFTTATYTSSSHRPPTSGSFDDHRSSPHSRVAELFNVNHFIVSQARPYIAPFISPHHAHSTSSSFYKVLGLEIRHRLQQMDTLGLLPTLIRKFLVDEVVPGSTVTVVPDLKMRDFEMLLENPSKEMVGYWVTKGEKSIWPVVGELEVRCRVEFCLDAVWEEVRSRNPVVGNRDRVQERD